MDFTIVRGDTPTFSITVTKLGLPYSLVGSSMWFTAKYSYADPDLSAVFQKTLGSGIVYTNAAQGLATATLVGTDTSALAPVKVLLVYDIQVKDAGGNIFTIARGNLIVVPDVTLAT